MGAWSPGIFQNDNALDLVALLQRAEAKPSLLGDAVRAYLKSSQPDASLEERALAAASIIAASAFAPVRGIAPAARRWVERCGYVPAKSDLENAHEAATRIAARSELHDLWEQSGDVNRWKSGLLKLIAALDAAQGSKTQERECRQPSTPKLLHKQLELYRQHPSPKLEAVIQKKIASLSKLNELTPDSGICLPLVLLIKHKFFAEAKGLVERGADPTLIEPRYNTAPAHLLACASGDLDLVECIFSRGISPFGYIAIEPSTGSLLEFASPEKFPPGLTPRRYSPPLLVALRHARVHIAKYLIELGADPREDCLGETALHRAVESGDLKTVEFVLEQGVDVNSVSRLGETALHLVIKAGKDRCAIARALLKGGVEPDRRDKFKTTILDNALDQGDTELAECLRRAR